MKRAGSERLQDCKTAKLHLSLTLTKVGSQSVYLTAGGKVLLLPESGAVVPLLISVASAPWPSPNAAARMLHTKSFPRQRSSEGAHHHI